MVDLASNALVFMPIAGEDVEAARIAGELELKTDDVGLHELTFDEAAELDLRVEGCGCFPGATGVLTPHGLVAIGSLHVGDLVLAEDPASGKVDSEKVQAVIDDGMQPLMQSG